MYQAAEDLNVVCPRTNDIEPRSGERQNVRPEDTSDALDLYTYVEKIHLSILHVCADTYWFLEVHEKKAETITALLDGWSESLALELQELTFLTDGESLRNSLFM